MCPHCPHTLESRMVDRFFRGQCHCPLLSSEDTEDMGDTKDTEDNKYMRDNRDMKLTLSLNDFVFPFLVF